MSSEGRLEVFHSGRWGTVCDDNFGANDATAICVMLGFMSGVTQSSVAGPGSGTIWMDEVSMSNVLIVFKVLQQRFQVSWFSS